MPVARAISAHDRPPSIGISRSRIAAQGGRGATQTRVARAGSCFAVSSEPWLTTRHSDPVAARPRGLRWAANPKAAGAPRSNRRRRPRFEQWSTLRPDDRTRLPDLRSPISPRVSRILTHPLRGDRAAARQGRAARFVSQPLRASFSCGRPANGTTRAAEAPLVS